MSAGPESNGTSQFFSPEKRVSFDRLDATFSSLDEPCASDAFVEGRVQMEWGFNANNRNHRFQLAETRVGFVVPDNRSILEVVFVSDALEKQRFLGKNMRLSLTGGMLEWTGAKAKKRPKLTFAKGIRLQKLDEKGKNVIETFDFLPTPSDIQERPPDWLTTPAPSSPPAAEDERPESDVEKKRKRSITPEPAISTLDFNDIRAEDDLDMGVWAGVSVADDKHVDAGRDASTSSRSSVSNDTEGRGAGTASAERPAPHSQISKSSTVHAEPPKKKPRMSSSGQKKSQPNLRAISQNSGTDSRSGSVTSGASVPEGKHRKKNAKKRQKEKERKAMEKAEKPETGDVPTAGSVIEPSPPPPLPPPAPARDPALDLLPGYKCTERTPTEYLAIADIQKNLQRK
ncbi:hypothetical protein M407DRAFT_18570, partial [Tulasnella calospora MUT 4182]